MTSMRQTQTVIIGGGAGGLGDGGGGGFGGLGVVAAICIGVLLLGAAAAALAAALAALVTIVKLIITALVGGVACLAFAGIGLALYRCRYQLARYISWAVAAPRYRPPAVRAAAGGPAPLAHAQPRVLPPALDDATLDQLAARVAEHITRR
jgi:hypothetical protein